MNDLERGRLKHLVIRACPMDAFYWNPSCTQVMFDVEKCGKCGSHCKVMKALQEGKTDNSGGCSCGGNC